MTTAPKNPPAEDAIRADVRAGTSLREARQKHRYHQLQTRNPG